MLEITYPLTAPELRGEAWELGADLAVACAVVEGFAKKLGKPVEMEVHRRSFSRLLDGAGSGEFDFTASAITILPEREERYKIAFSAPYHTTGYALMHSPREVPPASLDMPAKRIGVMRNTSSESCLQKLKADARKRFEIIGFDRNNEPFVDMQKDQTLVDYAATDTDIAIAWQLRNPRTVSIRPLTQRDFDGTNRSCWNQSYGIAMRRGETELRSTVNEVLEELARSGELERIKVGSQALYRTALTRPRGATENPELVALHDKLRSASATSYCRILIKETVEAGRRQSTSAQ